MSTQPWILLCGIPSEPPLEMAAHALDRIGAPYILLNQREFASAQCSFSIDEDGISGNLTTGGTEYDLAGICSVYTRLTDYQLLPEYVRATPEEQLGCELLHHNLTRWYEVMPGRVVNRARPSASNQSKPYQAQLIREFFPVPETLLTNDPREAAEFRQQHGRVIYKSTSGVRSIVQELTEADMERMDGLSWCPVQFQAYVAGVDIRVHVVGGEVFPTMVESDGIDYRYAHRESGVAAKLQPWPLDGATAEAALELARRLGLEFAGIDLRYTPEGEYVCFEVNPSPAYSYYEQHTGQPISDALARHLAWAA